MRSLTLGLLVTTMLVPLTGCLPNIMAQDPPPPRQTQVQHGAPVRAAPAKKVANTSPSATTHVASEGGHGGMGSGGRSGGGTGSSGGASSGGSSGGSSSGGTDTGGSSGGTDTGGTDTGGTDSGGTDGGDTGGGWDGN